MGLNIINLELIDCILKKNHEYIIINLTAPLKRKALYWKYRLLKFLSCLVGRVAIFKNNCFISLVKFLFGVFGSQGTFHHCLFIFHYFSYLHY